MIEKYHLRQLVLTTCCLRSQTFELYCSLKPINHLVLGKRVVMLDSYGYRYSLILGLEVCLYKAVTFTRLLIWKVRDS